MYAVNTNIKKNENKRPQLRVEGKNKKPAIDNSSAGKAMERMVAVCPITGDFDNTATNLSCSISLLTPVYTNNTINSAAVTSQIIIDVRELLIHISNTT
jgi:hypothetical protein